MISIRGSMFDTSGVACFNGKQEIIFPAIISSPITCALLTWPGNEIHHLFHLTRNSIASRFKYRKAQRNGPIPLVLSTEMPSLTHPLLLMQIVISSSLCETLKDLLRPKHNEGVPFPRITFGNWGFERYQGEIRITWFVIFQVVRVNRIKLANFKRLNLLV